ncbi:MAG: cytidylate kinase-like family protein [Armatimonadetes bacterium]|nr:cytidylate kinase-like family protein [Armatimonadota bacterium]
MPKSIEELVSSQVRKSESSRHKDSEKGKCLPNLVITISRTMGSGARVIAEKLAEELGWSFWGKELIEAIAKDADVSRKVVEAFDESTISEIELIARAALGDHEMGDFLYVRHLAKAVISIEKLGNAIILGRGANFILSNALHVRIDAPFETRVQNMIKFEGMHYDDAVAKLKHSDHDRHRFLVSLFGKERAEKTHFDLTLWMDKLTNDEAVHILKAAVKARCETMKAENLLRT